MLSALTPSPISRFRRFVAKLMRSRFGGQAQVRRAGCVTGEAYDQNCGQRGQKQKGCYPEEIPHEAPRHFLRYNYGLRRGANHMWMRVPSSYIECLRRSGGTVDATVSNTVGGNPVTFRIRASAPPNTTPAFYASKRLSSRCRQRILPTELPATPLPAGSAVASHIAHRRGDGQSEWHRNHA